MKSPRSLSGKQNQVGMELNRVASMHNYALIVQIHLPKTVSPAVNFGVIGEELAMHLFCSRLLQYSALPFPYRPFWRWAIMNFAISSEVELMEPAGQICTNFKRLRLKAAAGIGIAQRHVFR